MQGRKPDSPEPDELCIAHVLHSMECYMFFVYARLFSFLNPRLFPEKILWWLVAWKIVLLFAYSFPQTFRKEYFLFCNFTKANQNKAEWAKIRYSSFEYFYHPQFDYIKHSKKYLDLEKSELTSFILRLEYSTVYVQEVRKKLFWLDKNHTEKPSPIFKCINSASEFWWNLRHTTRHL